MDMTFEVLDAVLAARVSAHERKLAWTAAAIGERVEAGSRLASWAGTVMSDIVEQVARLHTLIDEISDASRRQASTIGQVGDAVNQLDGMALRNAALVEESAAAAAGFSQQAARLLQAMGIFRLARA